MFFKGLVAGCHSFCLFFIFYNIHTFILSHSFIRHHLPGPLSISASLVSSVGKTFLWCLAENRTRACLTASRRANNWVTHHHYYFLLLKCLPWECFCSWASHPRRRGDPQGRRTRRDRWWSSRSGPWASCAPRAGSAASSPAGWGSSSGSPPR